MSRRGALCEGRGEECRRVEEEEETAVEGVGEGEGEEADERLVGG